MTSSICVVMPMVNRASYMGEALDSVADQTVPSTELIVIDDRSRDDTEGRVQRHRLGSRIRYHRQTQRQGASVRPLAVEMARTDVCSRKRGGSPHLRVGYLGKGHGLTPMPFDKQTNSRFGMRDRERSLEATVKHIALVGDSFVQGLQVRDEDKVSRHLEILMGGTVEVLNSKKAVERNRGVAQREGFPVLHLSDGFLAAFCKSGPLELTYDGDGHWNAHGHAISPGAIKKFLSDNGWINNGV